MKQVLILVAVLLLFVAASSICVYTVFFNQLVLPLPSIKASESNSFGALMDTLQAEDEVVVEVKRGETSISKDDNQELFTITYTPQELDLLFQTGLNLAFNLNAQQTGQNFLTRIDSDFPVIRENIYLVGRFIDNLPFGFKLRITS